ncbi:MAG: hypothetical protein RIG63_16655 [Coleofasciculus chthonoplastes F3-SA18-01]
MTNDDHHRPPLTVPTYLPNRIVYTLGSSARRPFKPLTSNHTYDALQTIWTHRTTNASIFLWRDALSI